MEHSEIVISKKKPVGAYDFENIPRVRRNNAKCKMQNAESRSNDECRRARFRSQGGKYYCDGKVFEGEGALRAVWQYIWTMNFIRRRGASI